MFFWRVHLHRLKSAMEKPVQAILAFAIWCLKIGFLILIAIGIKTLFGSVPTYLILLFVGAVYLEQKIAALEHRHEVEILPLKIEVESLRGRIAQLEGES